MEAGFMVSGFLSLLLQLNKKNAKKQVGTFRISLIMIHGLNIKIKPKRLIREEKIINGKPLWHYRNAAVFYYNNLFYSSCLILNLTITNGILQ
jgi:hypothetical protein